MSIGDALIGATAFGGDFDEDAAEQSGDQVSTSGATGLLGSLMLGGDAEQTDVVIPPSGPAGETVLLGDSGMGWSMMGGDYGTTQSAPIITPIALSALLLDITTLTGSLSLGTPVSGSSTGDTDMTGVTGMGWGMLGGDGTPTAPPAAAAGLAGDIQDSTTLSGTLSVTDTTSAPHLSATLNDLTTLTGRTSFQMSIEIDGSVSAAKQRTLIWTASVLTSEQTTGRNILVPDRGFEVYYG